LLESAFDPRLSSAPKIGQEEQAVIIQLPVETEVLEKIGDLKPRGKAENNQIIIEFDTRQRDYHKLQQFSV
jgi:hypothetical protein